MRRASPHSSAPDAAPTSASNRARRGRGDARRVRDAVARDARARRRDARDASDGGGRRATTLDDDDDDAGVPRAVRSAVGNEGKRDVVDADEVRKNERECVLQTYGRGES